MAKQIIVLISGNGSNLQAIIDAVQAGQIKADIAAVISDNATAYGLQRALDANIPTQVLDPKPYTDRAAYDADLLRLIQSYTPDLVLLAGFMRILSADLVNALHGRMLNIHPSLLPKYRGLHTHRRALEAGDSEHGLSIHFVTEELDGGPLVYQARLPIHPNDTEASLKTRVQKLEHHAYPLVTEWFINEQLYLSEQNQVILNETALPSTGYQAKIEAA